MIRDQADLVLKTQLIFLHSFAASPLEIEFL